MKAIAAAWTRIGALCVGLIVALSLAVAPVSLAVAHGPGALAAEADHRAHHAEVGHGHAMPQGDHDSTDHDHVGAAILEAVGSEVHPAPQRTLRPETLVARGTIRDGPTRPPRMA